MSDDGLEADQPNDAGRDTASDSAIRWNLWLPSLSDYSRLRGSWKGDVIAGVTVGVVALPLALAFGISSGLGAAAGLITAIVAGLVAAVFGGSNVQVSGPTGAMAVVLVPIVARHGVEAVFMVGMLAGFLIVIAGIARLGRYLVFIPWPVIEGFTVGIAVIIFAQQVPAALGVPTPDGENTMVVAVRAIGDALTGSGALWAVGLTVLVVVVMVVSPRIHRGIPASLLGVIAATVIAALAQADVPVIGALPSSLPSPSLPMFSPGLISDLFGAILAVAALASLESLLSAKVADGMAGVGRHDANRELLGQGLANIVSPLFGGMPATGAIARTAVNVKAGARTRVASVVHSLVLIGVVFVGSSLVAEIPLAALAGVLMVTSVRMVEFSNVGAVMRATRSDGIVLMVTAFVTIAFDLILAVEFGMAVAALLALRQLARTSAPIADPLPLIDSDTAMALRRDHIVSYRFDGALFFGAVQRFLTELTQVGDVEVVILRFPSLQMLDASGAQAIGEIIEELEHRGVTVLIKGVRADHLRTLKEVGAIDRLAHGNHLFSDLDDAIAHARSHLARNRPAAPPAGKDSPSPRR